MCSFAASLARYMLVFLSMTALVACQSERANPLADPSLLEPLVDTSKGQNMNDDLIQVKLIAEPRQFSMAERQRFKLTITATNQGKQVIDPELGRTQLFVNGKNSMVWGLAISNGFREGRWFALPPGDTVSMSWSSMGPSLFPSPGEYTLTAHYGNKDLEPIQVHVLAE
jgi:hypothetical protein